MNQSPKESFLTVAMVTPKLVLGDVKANAENHISTLKSARVSNAAVVVFPELSLTGYTLGDLFENSSLNQKVEAGIELIRQASKSIQKTVIFGAPITYMNKLYNCAIVIHDGEVMGVVPKVNLPNYKEFYEKRWFESGEKIKNLTIELAGKNVPFGIDLLFKQGSVTFGIEICEDLWAPIPPSVSQAVAGAEVCINLSASNELIGKADFRRLLVRANSARILGGYVYVSAGVGESSADVVFSGHNLAAANGSIISEGKRFETEDIVLASFDLDHIRHDRRLNTTFSNDPGNYRIVRCHKEDQTSYTLPQTDPHPFVPSNKDSLNERSAEIIQMQAHGLASYLRNAGIKRVVLGLSGGLDSTLALLVSIEAMKILEYSSKNVLAVVMPGFASSDRTQDNARKLAKKLNVSFEEISIGDGASKMLESLGHDGSTPDTVYENSQARLRTEVLMNIANRDKSIVVGTGDLSEIALGWCTYNGDHMSMYNVNSSIPKTLVRHLVGWVSEQPSFKTAKETLKDIIDTPISPELIKTDKKITQKTEEIIGPYELHDFFLYYLVRHGDSREKMLLLAESAFSEKYSKTEIKKWLNVFLDRFTKNQFKRESAPNGPKVGTVSLSQRGDWRMPPGVSTNWI